MGEITIKLTDDAEARILARTTEHNNRLGAALTPADFVGLHIREWLVAEDMPTEIEALQRRYDRDLQSAIAAKKNELMGRLSVDAPAGPIVP